MVNLYDSEYKIEVYDSECNDRLTLTRKDFCKAKKVVESVGNCTWLVKLVLEGKIYLLGVYARLETAATALKGLCTAVFEGKDEYSFETDDEPFDSLTLYQELIEYGELNPVPYISSTEQNKKPAD